MNKISFGSLVDFFENRAEALRSIVFFLVADQQKKFFDRFLQICLDIEVMRTLLFGLAKRFNSIASLWQVNHPFLFLYGLKA